MIQPTEITDFLEKGSKAVLLSEKQTAFVLDRKARAVWGIERGPAHSPQRMRPDCWIRLP